MTNLRFVMTGGPGAGKTTVLEALAARGYKYVGESARAIIRQHLAAGLSPRPPLVQFGKEILSMDITQYQQTPVTDAPVFFDRGVVDSLSMLIQHGALSWAEAETQVAAFRYNEVVFLLPPWQAIYKNDAERDQTFAEAIQVFESLAQWYARWHYQTVEVPRASVEERVGFILDTVKLALASQDNRGAHTHR
jgi:predicted ATPase